MKGFKMEELVKGTVKTFNKEKGYGFITSEGGEDLFFHYSSLQMEGFKTVEKGQKVQFNIENGDRGNRAVNITVIA